MTITVLLKGKEHELKLFSASSLQVKHKKIFFFLDQSKLTPIATQLFTSGYSKFFSSPTLDYILKGFNDKKISCFFCLNLCLITPCAYLFVSTNQRFL